MARMTAEQKDAVAQLVSEYGETADISIEFTPHAYGLLRVVWHPVDYAGIPERKLYIRPDGTRLTWRDARVRGLEDRAESLRDEVRAIPGPASPDELEDLVERTLERFS